MRDYDDVDVMMMTTITQNLQSSFDDVDDDCGHVNYPQREDLSSNNIGRLCELCSKGAVHYFRLID